MQQIGWEQPDVILFSGDAYVDHPAFGAAVIGRTLEAEGLKVVIVPQPNWQDDLRDFRKFGTPRLFFAVSAGNMDSMVNHYTANRRRRSDDAYTPGGKAGMRPDYAASVYTKILKELYPDVPVVLGGIEASLRRLTHYDYWQDELKPGIMAWSGADLLIYGMGEQPLRELVRLLGRGVPFASLTTLAQTVVMQSAAQPLHAHKKWITIELNSHEACLDDKLKYAANFKHIEQESNSLNAARQAQICRQFQTHRTGIEQFECRTTHPAMAGTGNDRKSALPAGCRAGTRQELRLALHPFAAPEVPQQGPHSGLRNDQALHYSALCVLWRLQFLYHIGPSGQIHFLALGGFHSAGGRAGNANGRF